MNGNKTIGYLKIGVFFIQIISIICMIYFIIKYKHHVQKETIIPKCILEVSNDGNTWEPYVLNEKEYLNYKKGEVITIRYVFTGNKKGN